MFQIVILQAITTLQHQKHCHATETVHDQVGWPLKQDVLHAKHGSEHLPFVSTEDAMGLHSCCQIRMSLWVIE